MCSLKMQMIDFAVEFEKLSNKRSSDESVKFAVSLTSLNPSFNACSNHSFTPFALWPEKK